MQKERSIAKVVRQVSFAEAEAEDDRFWAKASETERWEELIRLRWMVFGGEEGVPLKIEKVVKTRSLYETADNEP